MNNDHAAHRSRIERFDIVKPHVALTCAPVCEWIVLREDCLARCVWDWTSQTARESIPERIGTGGFQLTAQERSLVLSVRWKVKRTLEGMESKEDPTTT